MFDMLSACIGALPGCHPRVQVDRSRFPMLGCACVTLSKELAKRGHFAGSSLAKFGRESKQLMMAGQSLGTLSLFDQPGSALLRNWVDRNYP